MLLGTARIGAAKWACLGLEHTRLVSVGWATAVLDPPAGVPLGRDRSHSDLGIREHRLCLAFACKKGRCRYALAAQACVLCFNVSEYFDQVEKDPWKFLRVRP